MTPIVVAGIVIALLAGAVSTLLLLAKLKGVQLSAARVEADRDNWRAKSVDLEERLTLSERIRHEETARLQTLIRDLRAGEEKALEESTAALRPGDVRRAADELLSPDWEDDVTDPRIKH